MRVLAGEEQGAQDRIAELLGRFRDTMTSDDPYVRAWTTRLIEEREQNLAWLLERS